MSGGHFPINQLLIIRGRKMSTRQCVICNTEKKTANGIHCRKCADIIASASRTKRKHYDRCILCDAIKVKSINPHCVSCGRKVAAQNNTKPKETYYCACGSIKKTKCSPHCRKCADKIAGSKRAIYRTKIRYSHCKICGIEKRTKDHQYTQYCEKCGKTTIRHPETFKEYETGFRDCRTCKISKPLTEFVAHGKIWKRVCKKCDNERRKQILYARRKADPLFRLKENMGRAVYTTLKHNKDNKPTFSLLPYTKEQLKEHIQNQFDNNMTWDNYGSYWHLDHIIPQDALPYDSFEHPNFFKCWALDNLQPLEAKANIRKSNKIIE
jgi:hypothetical protein